MYQTHGKIFCSLDGSIILSFGLVQNNSNPSTDWRRRKHFHTWEESSWWLTYQRKKLSRRTGSFLWCSCPWSLSSSRSSDTFQPFFNDGQKQDQSEINIDRNRQEEIVRKEKFNFHAIKLKEIFELLTFQEVSLMEL